MPQQRPRVVIAGAGFGGLEAAKALRSAAADVSVIDQQNHHCFQPLLYQVATAALSPADVAWPIRRILRKQGNATVLMAEIRGVDAGERIVHTDSIGVPYDFLVLATGATHSYFGHDEWAEAAPGLKRIEDATRIRRRILIAFERAELTGDAAERARQLTFVIVGAGATGVEMAGAITEVARQTLAKDFRRIDPKASRIVLIEAGPRVMPTLPANLSDYVRATLVQKGVEVMTSTRVVGCDPRGVDLADGRIDAATVIWAAGVVASPAARWLEVEHDRAGRVKVGADLSVSGHPEIFAIGDTAAAIDPAGRAIPGIAPAAKQMGRYVGRLIAARIAGAPPPEPFRYRHQGDLATIGRRAAVVKLGRLELRGVFGWLFWSVVHIFFLIEIRDRFVVAFTWLWDYVTFQRGARLITRVPPQERS
ncbi:MAG TPA: NAD(P)/FAD-dependent oxidoreductase [Xanthobacteraceae bacterium]|nr:NAD(P)/FAD-dependent oxidoreductase [Xanthobacteraceae bacterium]